MNNEGIAPFCLHIFDLILILAFDNTRTKSHNVQKIWLFQRRIANVYAELNICLSQNPMRKRHIDLSRQETYLEVKQSKPL